MKDLVEILQFLSVHVCFSHQADAVFREYLIYKSADLLTPPFKTLPFKTIIALQLPNFHTNFLNEVLLLWSKLDY